MRKLAYFLRRNAPHGLLGWRYLFPENDRLVALHRQILLQGRERYPKGLWLAFELWLALRWRVFHAIPSAWKAVRHFGAAVRQNTGIPIWRQAWIVLGLAYAWGIQPAQAYKFGLYREPERALDYVYDSEVPVYQHWRNRARGKHADSLQVIQDKQALAEKLAQHGLPVVASLQIIVRSDAPPALASLISPGVAVFCKTRTGNRGIGAFSVRGDAGELRGQTFQGKMLENASAVEAAWRKLCKLDDALIQPCLENHPAVSGLAYNTEVITVRYISRWQGEQITCLGATLEVPVGKSEKSGRTSYGILPIESESGLLQPFPLQAHWSEKMRTDAELLWEKAKLLGKLPDWEQLVLASQRAHALFADIDAIAWDWVLTPQGPILLEGNTGWGTATPQVLDGGLLVRY